MFSSVFTIQNAVLSFQQFGRFEQCQTLLYIIQQAHHSRKQYQWQQRMKGLYGLLVCFIFVTHCSSFIFLSVDLSSHCMSNGDAKTAATMEFMMIPIAAANRRKITRDKKKSEKQKKKYLHYKNWRKNSRFKRDKILQCKIREPNKSIVLVLVLHPQSTFSFIRFDVYFALDENNVVGSNTECIISFQCSNSLK